MRTYYYTRLAVIKDYIQLVAVLISGLEQLFLDDANGFDVVEDFDCFNDLGLHRL